MQRFWQGETVRARVRFTDEMGTDLAAVGVAIIVKKPDGVTAPYPVAAESASVFYADIPVDQAGEWWVRASCDGPTITADEMRFSVAVSGVL